MPKKLLAIALCRVSSLEQLESNSLNHQRDNVLRAADMLGVTIPDDGIWSGHVSSKKGVNYDRKDLKEMLEYCRKHRDVKYLIVQEVDRFMRSPDEQVYFQVKFRNEVDVKIWYADKPELNNDDIYAGLMRYMEGFRAAGSNDERQRKSINGQTKALEEGRFPFAPKPGYVRGTERGIQLVHPAKGPILKSILLDIAAYKKTPSQALVDLNKSDFVNNHSLYKMDKFRTIITDPFYAGIVEINKQVHVRNENGLHEPLISKKQHLDLIHIMENKKKNQNGPRKNGNPKYPLSNLVSCATCTDKKNGRFVGFDHGNGKNLTLVYEKYRCRSCGRYLTRQDLHHKIEHTLKGSILSDKGSKKLLKALDIVWKQEEGQAEQKIQRLRHRIDVASETVSNQAMAAIDPSNITIKSEILSNIEKEKQLIVTLEQELSSIEFDVDDDKERFLKFAFHFIENMATEFIEISQENRLKCKQLLFPMGFYVDTNNKVYTPQTSPLIRLANNKKDLPETEKSFMVRVQGL